MNGELFKKSGPVKPVTPLPEVERCAPGGCEYLIHVDGKKFRECGEPAKYRFNRAHSMRYCQLHGDHVRSRMKRGGSIEMVELQPHELKK